MTLPGRRFSGVLLHPTSLPGPYGLGEFGPEALRFMALLRKADQRVWQMLPLGPTGYGESPYQALSAFAGNALLIGMDWLCRDGLLEDAELRRLKACPQGRAAFEQVGPLRAALLARAAQRFERKAAPALRARLQTFVRRQGAWLEDFALYAALKQAHDGAAWFEWPRALARREPQSLRAARRDLAESLRRVTIEQFLFNEHWQRLRRAARQRGLYLFGDLPFFAALDSADVWARPQLFQLDAAGRPTRVAGVPPDYFSAAGQRWGNPLYRWRAHQADGYAWWRARLRRLLQHMDMVRIDHFRGVCAHWSVPVDAPSAAAGAWKRGPGQAFFRHLSAELGPLPLVAENLGVITPAVERLRKRCGYPGMQILQFVLAPQRTTRGWAVPPPEIPEDSIVYTGTHDNDTLRGWFQHQEDREGDRPRPRAGDWQRAVLQCLGGSPEKVHWGAVEWSLRSPARGAVTPWQDILGLDSCARMNRPGHPAGNWRWRFRWEQVHEHDLRQLQRLTAAGGRTG